MSEGTFFGIPDGPLPARGPGARRVYFSEEIRRLDEALRRPDPRRHDIAEVWDNAAALTARTCQRCGRTFAPRQLAVHPDDERGGQLIADRERLELVLSFIAPRGHPIVLDEVAIDWLGCLG